MEANPRCYDHRDRKAAPLGCTTCQRILIESIIVQRVVDALLAAGYSLNIDDGDDWRLEQHTTERAVILRELMETDDDFLAVAKDTSVTTTGWVRFIYGNDGWDVISDYTTNLDPVLQPVLDWVDAEVAP